MKITLIWIGKSSGMHITEGIAVFEKRIRRYHHFEIAEIHNIKNSEKMNPNLVKKKEGELLLQKLHPDDYVVLLDEKGKAYNSEVFAGFLQKMMLQSVKRLVFVIGGAYGFDKSVKDKANLKLALSPMTFSHQLIRVIFLEQLYRANTIIRNEPYHNA